MLVIFVRIKRLQFCVHLLSINTTRATPLEGQPSLVKVPLQLHIQGGRKGEWPAKNDDEGQVAPFLVGCYTVTCRLRPEAKSYVKCAGGLSIRRAHQTTAKADRSIEALDTK